MADARHQALPLGLNRFLQRNRISEGRIGRAHRLHHRRAGVAHLGQGEIDFAFDDAAGLAGTARHPANGCAAPLRGWGALFDARALAVAPEVIRRTPSSSV